MPKPTQAEFVCSSNSGLSKEPAPVLREPCNLGSDAQGEVTPGQSQDTSLPSSCFTDKFWHFSQLKNLVAQYIDTRNGVLMLYAHFLLCARTECLYCCWGKANPLEMCVIMAMGSPGWSVLWLRPQFHVTFINI